MDLLRVGLWMGIALILLLLWQAWQQDYPAAPVQPPEQAAATDALPQSAAAQADLPPAQAAPPATGTPPAEAAAEPAAQASAAADVVRVRTDVLEVELGTEGADLRRVALLAYPVEADRPEAPFALLNDRPGQWYVTQSGLIGPGAPTHHARWQAETTDYRLASGADSLSVPMTYRTDDGLTVRKVFEFRRGAYQVGLRYEIDNGTGSALSLQPYYQIQRSPPDDSTQSAFIYTYTGGVLHTPQDPYRKLSFDDLAEEDLIATAPQGWAAMIQHYFLSALIPPPQQESGYYSKALAGQRYVLGTMPPAQAVPAGGQASTGIEMYVGPKLQHVLEQIAPGLELTVDYGYLTFLAKPIYWLLEFIHGLVRNWGWAIVLLTMLIKLAFYKLSETSYRSMANLRQLHPRLVALKERHGDDRQRLNQAMMEMYKKEKINPLGGCLPILVQVPVFIALYWVLLESVELRQAPWTLWIDDLSSKDPYYVLPLIMGITMFVQQRLNPAPVDPIQQKVMMALPVVFTVFFAFFPAGLVLYWVANNALSILQQWVITRRVAAEAKPKPA